MVQNIFKLLVITMVILISPNFIISADEFNKEIVKIGNHKFLKREQVDLNYSKINVNTIQRFNIFQPKFAFFTLNNKMFVIDMSGNFYLIDLNQNKTISTEKPDFLQDDKLINNIKRYGLMFNGENCLIYYVLYRSTDNENSIKNKIENSVIIYNYNRINITKNENKTIETVSIEKVNIETNKLKKYFDPSIVRMSFSSDANIEQNSDTYILYNESSHRVIKYNIVNNTEKILDENESNKYLNKYLEFNLNGILASGESYIYNKYNRRDELEHGVYDFDEKSKQKIQIFQHGDLAYWCPDEKHRIVIVDGKNKEQYMILLSEDGKKVFRISYKTTNDFEPLCLSTDKTKLVIAEQNELKVLLLNKPLY